MSARCHVQRQILTVFLCVACIDEVSSTLASITRLKSQLSDIIEPDFGLLDQLLSLEVLTRRQCDKIRAGDKAAYERSEAVLDLLTAEDASLDPLTSEAKCEKFIAALQRTEQQHVVNFITHVVNFITQNRGENDNCLTLHYNQSINQSIKQTNKQTNK